MVQNNHNDWRRRLNDRLLRGLADDCHDAVAWLSVGLRMDVIRRVPLPVIEEDFVYLRKEIAELIRLFRGTTSA